MTTLFATLRDLIALCRAITSPPRPTRELPRWVDRHDPALYDDRGRVRQ